MTGRPSTLKGFRWTCPFCGTSRLNASGDESGRENALAALRTHIVASDGAGHGPRNEYPGAIDDVTLAEHVDPVDGRDSTTNRTNGR